MRIRVLGPLRVRVEDEWRPVSVPKQRLILGMLLVNRGRLVSSDQIIDELWGECPPGGALRTLRSYVSRLRDCLEPERAPGSSALIEADVGGYAFTAVAGDVDVDRFERLASAGAADLLDGRVGAAQAQLVEALELWSGDAYEDLRYASFVQAEVARLDEARLVCLEDRIEADLQLGHPRAVVAELRALTSAHPGRERLWEQSMVALYRCGQQSEALRAFRQARAVLLEDYGVEPAAGLVELERRILNQDLPATVTAPGGSRRRDVPLRTDTFVGRALEAEAIRSLLSDHRLVTLTGFGGVGKTSLAFEVARSMADLFQDGTYVVRLAPVTELSEATEVLASTLGVRGHPTRETLDVLVDGLIEREVLVVLDNCEHLVIDAGHIVSELLARCPKLRVLATSRVPMRVAGERVWPVPPLETPDVADDRARSLALDHAASSEAVALFAERARQHHPGFRLDASNYLDVAELCRRLDGVPLALELAAARVRVLSPSELLARLDDRFQLLANSDQRGRHSSLVSAIGWSYDLLEPGDRTLLQRLAVFEGGFTLDAVESVCSDAELAAEAVLDGLSRLVDASLVTASRDRSTRFGMLESVHDFARLKLASSGEDAALRSKHAAYFAAILPGFPGPDTPDGNLTLEQLSREEANHRRALAWAITAGDGALAVRFASRLLRLWEARGQRGEQIRWLLQVRDVAAGVRSPDRVRVLIMLGHGLTCAGRREGLPSIIDELTDLAVDLDDGVLSAYAAGVEPTYLWSEGRPLEALARTESNIHMLRSDSPPDLSIHLLEATRLAIYVGHFDRAAQHIDELDRSSRTHDQRTIAALATGRRGMLAHYLGDLADADRLLSAALEELRRIDRIESTRDVFREIAQVRLAQGRIDDALTTATELVEAGQQLQIAEDMSEGHVLRARAHLAAKRHGDAANEAGEALRIVLESNDQRGRALLADTVAELAASLGDSDAAILLHGSADRYRERTGLRSPAARQHELDELQRVERAAVSDRRFDELRREGADADRIGSTIRAVLAAAARADCSTRPSN